MPLFIVGTEDLCVGSHSGGRDCNFSLMVGVPNVDRHQ